ncbi:hypothetical protein BY458DRAFT_583079 [Sporodiniella umbellata]|nr:hypothetical protein BY458DRAFT_583079 [Sporodiniella umbellata]
MSSTSRYRERKYNTSENDRLLRALSQPVQAWDKSWALHSNSKTLQTYKWVKSERLIEFEEDEESEHEVESMETTQVAAKKEVEEKQDIEMKEASGVATKETEVEQPTTINKLLNNVKQEQPEEEENQSHTPKLDDISDEEPEQSLDNEDDDNDADNINDPSKHPALAPHAEAHMTDDDLLTDSTAATPFTENDTPLPNSLNEITEEPENKIASPKPASD